MDKDMEDSQKEIYYEEEAEYEEEEAGEEKALARMKCEFQTSNKIWRNDGKTSSVLPRKYGPNDFLFKNEKKGVRLEAETDGVLEFETEWFRTWPKLKEAIEEAVKMTDDMNRAASAKYEKTRKAFPFNVDHLRTGSANEINKGYWNPASYPRYENRHWNIDSTKYEHERILRAGEDLEVEIIDPKWKAAIQTSESFFLEYYESFLRQHERLSLVEGTIKHAQAILDAANTRGIPVTELVKLRSFLQIIVNYIMRGRSVDLKGQPSKFAFRLMSRTNFASMYESLLTPKEKEMFKEIVKNETILNKELKEMGLDRNDRLFKNGYGTEGHCGPTIGEWLAGLVRGVDLLSVRSEKGLSAAMGRYNVEKKKGKKDQWHVKFETRGTRIGRVREAKDWEDYAHKLFDLASKRERDALNLLHQQGIVDENKLTNFVFHARHPELGGRRIRKDEQALAQEWQQIRDDLVRPHLQGVQPELQEFEGTGGSWKERRN